VLYSGFRSWLAARLLGSRYATTPLRDEEIDAVAKRLGVDPDLLLEVRARARVELHERGLAPALSNSKILNEGHKRLYQYQMVLPEEIHRIWNGECERRGAHGPTLLRSLIHEYLLGEREPVPARHWSWEGKLYQHFRKSGFDQKAVITQGAKRALMRRTALLGVRPTALVRGLMLEAMRGEHGTVQLVTAAMMYDDEDRYRTAPPAT